MRVRAENAVSEGHDGVFYELGKRAPGEPSHMGRGAAPLQTIPGENGGECLYCISKMRANKRFVQGE